MLTSLAVLVSAPSVSRAADDVTTNPNAEITLNDSMTAPVELDESCSPGCIHTVTGDTTKYGIIVKSGTHKIILKGAKIDLSGNAAAGATGGREPFRIEEGATVNLVLSQSDSGNSNNVIKSAGTTAGIFVPAGTNPATLNIEEDPNKPGALDVTGSDGGAGIGGQSSGPSGTAGNINIKNGTIKAQGGSGAAGIGGSAGGGD